MGHVVYRIARKGLLAALGLFCMLPLAYGQVELSTIDLITRERMIRVPASVRDGYGKPISGDLIVTVFRPPGPGPFPLAVINHGRDSLRRSSMLRPRYPEVAVVFARQGYAIAVPQRLGYGELAVHGDPEDSMSCASPVFGPAIEAAGRQVIEVVRRLHQENDVDPNHILLVGISLGGMTSIAAGALGVPGLRGVVNFAGGHGGRPDTHPGDPCGPRVLERALAGWGAKSKVPTLWIYAENDRYFTPQVTQRWHNAYVSGGGVAEWRLFPPFGSDGHNLFGSGIHLWQPVVLEFLSKTSTNASATK